MRFFPHDKGKMAFFEGFALENGLFEGFSLKMAFSLYRLGKKENRMSQGVENRGSLISVPLALRAGCHRTNCLYLCAFSFPDLRLGQTSVARIDLHVRDGSSCYGSSCCSLSIVNLTVAVEP